MATTFGERAVPYTSVAPDQIGIRPPAFRLPDATRIGRIALQVADLERSIAFYQDVIGFRILGRGATAAQLGMPGDDRVWLDVAEKKGARPVPRRGLLGLYHFAVRLPTRGDLGRFLRHANRPGLHVGAADHAYSEATYLVDPDGLSVEVYRDRPRAEWLVRDGEILGASEPLAHDDLTAAAGAEPWLGLPAATVVGHVHFYVGDIGRAAAFYHAALGFDQVGWSWGPTALFLSAGGYHHHVGLNTWAAGSPVATDEDARLLEWELVVPDASAVEDAAASLERAGSQVARTRHGILAADPWGINVRVVAEGGTESRAGDAA